MAASGRRRSCELAIAFVSASVAILGFALATLSCGSADARRLLRFGIIAIDGSPRQYAALVIQHSVSQAKNKMRKTVEAIIDPPPRDVQPIWDHFGSMCAYCGASLSRLDRKAHIDHATADGGNQLGNLVLACSTCNGDEKLDEPWREFLRRKAPEAAVYGERERRIARWIEAHPLVALPTGPAIDNARAELETLIDEFADKCKELRQLVVADGHGPTPSAGRALSSDGSPQG